MKWIKWYSGSNFTGNCSLINLKGNSKLWKYFGVQIKQGLLDLIKIMKMSKISICATCHNQKINSMHIRLSDRDVFSLNLPQFDSMLSEQLKNEKSFYTTKGSKSVFFVNTISSWCVLRLHTTILLSIGGLTFSPWMSKRRILETACPNNMWSSSK